MSSSYDYNRYVDTRKHVWTKKVDPAGNPPRIIDEGAEGVGYGFFCAGNEWHHVSYD